MEYFFHFLKFLAVFVLIISASIGLMHLASGGVF
jgi:hypothetical protein